MKQGSNSKIKLNDRYLTKYINTYGVHNVASMINIQGREFCKVGVYTVPSLSGETVLSEQTLQTHFSVFHFICIFPRDLLIYCTNTPSNY